MHDFVQYVQMRAGWPHYRGDFQRRAGWPCFRGDFVRYMQMHVGWPHYRGDFVRYMQMCAGWPHHRGDFVWHRTLGNIRGYPFLGNVYYQPSFRAYTLKKFSSPESRPRTCEWFWYMIILCVSAVVLLLLLFFSVFFSRKSVGSIFSE